MSRSDTGVAPPSLHSAPLPLRYCAGARDVNVRPATAPIVFSGKPPNLR